MNIFNVSKYSIYYSYWYANGYISGQWKSFQDLSWYLEKMFQAHTVFYPQTWNWPFLQRALIPFSEKWFLEIKMWILEVYISTELVFISKLFSGQNGKFYVCECVFLFKMNYIVSLNWYFQFKLKTIRVTFSLSHLSSQELHFLKDISDGRIKISHINHLLSSSSSGDLRIVILKQVVAIWLPKMERI